VVRGNGGGGASWVGAVSSEALAVQSLPVVPVVLQERNGKTRTGEGGREELRRRGSEPVRRV